LKSAGLTLDRPRERRQAEGASIDTDEVDEEESEPKMRARNRRAVRHGGDPTRALRESR